MRTGPRDPRRMLKLPKNSRYWSEADGRRVVEAWQRSGESASAFARRHRLRTRRLEYWRKRVAVGALAPSVSFVPAAVVVPDSLAAVIRAPGGVEIELAQATPTQIAEVALAVTRAVA